MMPHETQKDKTDISLYPYEFNQELRKKAEVYHRISLFFSLINTEVLVNALFFILIITGMSVWMRSVAETVSEAWMVSTAVYASIFIFLVWIVILITELWFRSMLMKLAKKRFPGRMLIKKGIMSLCLGEIIGITVIVFLYFFIRSFEYWWLPVSMIMGVYLFLEVLIASPETLKKQDIPILKTPSEKLREKYASLIKTSGLKKKVTLSLFDIKLGSSAFSIGVGKSMCIAISEKILPYLHDDELDIILAHEIAHHVNRDALRKCAATILLMVGVVFLVAQVLPYFTGRFGILSIHDPANLPLLLLMSNIFALLLSPVFNLYSRKIETSADRYALALTKNKVAFISCQKKLADIELAPYNLTFIEKLFFASHPPVCERLSLIKEDIHKKNQTHSNHGPKE